jgi:hypothetical protein
MGKFTQKWYGKKWVRLSQETSGAAQDWRPASGSRDKVPNPALFANINYVMWPDPLWACDEINFPGERLAQGA